MHLHALYLIMLGVFVDAFTKYGTQQCSVVSVRAFPRLFSQLVTSFMDCTTINASSSNRGRAESLFEIVTSSWEPLCRF